MNEAKFNYIIGILVVLIFIFVVYIGNKVNVLEDSIIDLGDRVNVLEGAALGYGDLGAYDDLGYYDGLNVEDSEYAFDPYGGDYYSDPLLE